MFRHRFQVSQTFFLLLLSLPLGAASCRGGFHSAPVAPKQTVLKVNGVAISELEVAMETRRGHGADDSTESRDQILDGLVLKEAMAQKAIDLGLQNDEGLKERLARAEAQLASQRRKELARLFYKHEILDKVTVTDQEAKELYDRNQARIRAEVHVAQILTRDQAEAERALKDLKEGKSFDEVAGRAYPNLPPGAIAPWDLGYLKWKNVPPDWSNAVYSLQPGQNSGIIKGPGRRFWIVKLIEKRENPEMTYENVKADLMDELKSTKAEELRTSLETKLRREANVEKFPSISSSATPLSQNERGNSRGTVFKGENRLP
jgi:hypothetical protein